MPNDKLPDVETPVNVHEQYLYAMVVRLDALCNMVSSLVEHIAERDKVATENHVVSEVKENEPKTTRKQSKKSNA